jgi:hypothetical protein
MSPEQLTMIVNAAPLFATILCRWFGRLAIPIGDGLSTPFPEGIVLVVLTGTDCEITLLRVPRIFGGIKAFAT